MLKIVKFGVKIELIQLYSGVILLDYVIIEHDRITMTIPTSIPCGDGFLAHIVKYFNINYFIKTGTKLYHNYTISKLCRHK